jgi:hypothetical protein
MEKATYINKEIGTIVVPTTSTNAVMEMGNGATILNNPGNIEIPNVQTARVLGADINDNVYFGEEVNNKITQIYYKALNNEKLPWHTLTLGVPVDKGDIEIDYSGKVYINDEAAGSVLELISKKTIKYEGQLIQAYSKGIISRANDKLIKYEIGENKLSIH